jgi:hypothetical protein
MADEAAASSMQAAAALASLHLPQPGPAGGRPKVPFFLSTFIFCSKRLEMLVRLRHISLESSAKS